MTPLIAQPIPNSFAARLSAYSQDKFTGRLDIKVSSRAHWRLYLHLGRLVWAAGGLHPVRRWQRHLKRYCPTLNPQAFSLRSNEVPECWDYHALGLLGLRKSPQAEQLKAIWQGIIDEVLFDILRAIALTSVAHTSAQLDRPQQDALPKEDNTLPFVISAVPGVRPSNTGMLLHKFASNLETALDRAEQDWQSWVAAGLTRCCPDLAPLSSNLMTLHPNLDSSVYRKLVAALDGKRTLRDLALAARKDLLTVTRALVPYISQNLIKLIPLKDFPQPRFLERPPETPRRSIPARRTTAAVKRPLVIGIDDSPTVLARIEAILSTTNYQFLAIPDPISALPTLLQYKPDFIFLDLAMPIANGYEVCCQIRRVSRFHNIPIVILTGNDGPIDRIRAKLVGATDFMAKPLEDDKILAILHKYCPVPESDR
ncbi:response regulator [Oscillatoria sp. FACHB-1406]|uniref:response regulator n=1 Tax=Oscillatoria sp. FACHB-1406 TaxID=2692846 RepID=UPI0016859A7D|nr:response regulator [Oscillatoria sp. FACHB-1406]MBD2578690.1 response regulator [Oscillatoria sp. FACHB-1406]